MSTRRITKYFSTGLLLILFMSMSSAVVSQSEISDEIKQEESVFIDGISPFILGSGQIEVSNTSSLISYWNKVRIFNISGGELTNIYRLSIFQNRTSISYGFSESRRWDLGAEVIYSRRRWDDIANSSPFKVLSGDEANTGGLAFLGVKARFQPLANTPELTLQASLRIPMANGDQLRRDLGASSMQMSIFSTYYNVIGYNTAFFLQGGWTYALPKTFEETNTKVPSNHSLALGGFLSINLLGQKIYAVPGLSYSGNFRKSARSSRILQLSHGVFGEFILQFQLGSNFTLNLQESYPLLFESYSPTVEFERRSFSLSTIGLRYLL